MKELEADDILMNLRKVALVTPDAKKVKAAILTAIGRIEATMFNQGCILAYQIILLLEPVITNYHLCEQTGLKLLQKFQSDFEESIMDLDYKVISFHIRIIMMVFHLDMAAKKKRRVALGCRIGNNSSSAETLQKAGRWTQCHPNVCIQRLGDNQKL